MCAFTDRPQSNIRTMVWFKMCSQVCMGSLYSFFAGFKGVSIGLFKKKLNAKISIHNEMKNITTGKLEMFPKKSCFIVWKNVLSSWKAMIELWQMIRCSALKPKKNSRRNTNIKYPFWYLKNYNYICKIIVDQVIESFFGALGCYSKRK